LKVEKIFPVIVVLFSLGFLTLCGFLDRPTVEVSTRTQRCVRAYDPHGLLPCSEAMKRLPKKVLVDL